MASDENSLRALENLMNEFFDAVTTNERKHTIEELLNNFSLQDGAWKHCLYFMTNTQNEYVMMYCSTVLETLINKKWLLGVMGMDKTEIRAMLNSYLLSNHDKVPNYIRNKLVKLIVDIGRLDWPHFYPDFFHNILQLIQQSETVLLGLIMLQTTSEEMISPREDLNISRKEELRRLLLQQVPAILTLVGGILDSTLEKHHHLVMATPPPSPTQGQTTCERQRRSSLSVSIFSSSPVQTGNILNNMFKSPMSKISIESLPPLNTNSYLVSMTALNCLSHLFTWIPLSSTMTPSLLTTIFRFAGFGCETSQGRTSSIGNQCCEQNHLLGIQSMNCINELLSKNCVPLELEDFLLQMFQQTFYILQRLTKESGTNSSGNRLQELDEGYIDKFTEFLQLFVSIHLRRFESNSQFPVLDFLSLLFKYTFKQPTFDGYFACLDIWNIFLDYISTQMKMQSRNQDGNNLLDKYKDALMSLLARILEKLRFRFNQSQLDELDDDTVDDNSETEWQSFLRQNLEVVAKICDLMSVESFQILLEPFGEYFDTYIGLEFYVTNDGDSRRKLLINNESECRRLHCTLRDLCSLLQAIGRLVDHFIGENFPQRFNDAIDLLDRLLNIAAFSTKMKLNETNSEQVLQSDFIELHAQSLASLKTFTHWLTQFGSETQQHTQHKDKFVSIVMSHIKVVTPLFEKDIPKKIVHSAAHLFVSLMTLVRPPFLLQLPEIQALYNNCSQGYYSSFSNDIQLLIYKSLANYLILPWPNLLDTEQDWLDRANHHEGFIKQLTQQYRQLKSSPGLPDDKTLQEQAKLCIKKTLEMMVNQVESISGEVVKTKQICYQSIQEVVQVTLSLFPVYIHNPDVIQDILVFFLALFESLQVQMGVQFTEQSIQTFMNLFTREQLSKILMEETTAGIQVIEKFLKILELIVKEPGASFRAFLPSIISIIMEHIYPIIAERSSPDIKSTLYAILHQLLIYNWRYFFKTPVITVIKSQTEELDNQSQFIAIMQAFGQSFLQPDISIFKQNLEALENLNSKCKLYHRKIFKDLMLLQFMNVLLQVLVHKSHDILQEEIGISLYNMASVDFDRFYKLFLPQFLDNTDGLDSNQKCVLAENFKMDKDLPSFTQNIQRFVNDLRYYRLCLNSLPAGSVMLP
ncbi:exportin-6-like [Tubulanus polymorphus]|uniref:exportin-6-like n=1 Tax=Tubulanus polymorphus TaxID=672921 RepID=UPI003DA47A29